MAISITKQSFFALLLVLFAFSCKKEETPSQKINGQGPIADGIKGAGKVSYFAKASSTAPKGTGVKAFATTTTTTDSAYVQWSSATIFVEKISFVATNNNLLDTTIAVGKNLDILNADVLTGIFNLPAGSYKDVKVKLFLKKANFPELAFKLNGTFTNNAGGTDSITVASSMPFEANLAVNDITIHPADNYKVVFNFNLDKVLAGISAISLQGSASSHVKDGKRTYYIWKGGSQDEPFFNQVTSNWQQVASAVISKQ